VRHGKAGTSFPPIDFAQPNLVEDLIGPYAIQVTYYDRDYRPVTTAETSGRYGAVIEVTPKVASGNGNGLLRPIRRYQTLFRIPLA